MQQEGAKNLTTEEEDNYGTDAIDSFSLDGPTDSQLSSVVDLARMQIKLEREVAKREADLADAKARLNAIRGNALPHLMAELHLADYSVLCEDGRSRAKVALRSKIVGNILKDDEPGAFAWLFKQGYGPIVKTVVEARFSMGDADRAKDLLDYLLRSYKDFPASSKQAIHASTLNAWAKGFYLKQRDAMANGGRVVELPDAIKIVELKQTVITLPDGVTDI